MTTDSKIHPLQKFRTGNVHRSQINEAPYNPRTITDEHRKTLGNNLETRGLLETLVWNEATGNLVSGHQRLAKMDAYHQKKFKNLDYELSMAIVNLTPQEEVEQNIFFNNHRAMGVFDDDKLFQIINEMPDFDPVSAGMNDEDIAFFGITQDLEGLDNVAVNECIQQFEDIKQQKSDAITPEVKEARKAEVKAAKSEQKNNEVDTIVTITFSNQADKRAFMQLIGEHEQGLYIKGEPFVQKFFNLWPTPKTY